MSEGTIAMVTKTVEPVSGWLGSPLVEIAGTQLTAFMLIRTALIVVATILLVRMVRKALERASSEHPDVTRSGYWLIGKLAKWGLIMIGAFMALSSMGVSLTKATLIMSALTVGIGFGLQNIVNNFVSGLILMMERSVRVGDWIEVGSTQGIVKQMNIRSTIVSTFDRAEVIVPNSDMISSHVTNWTLLDTVGRVVIEFEVHLPGDPDKVRQLLESIAKGHAGVCSGPQPAGPVVRVSDIGVRGLTYRIQCFVADVNTKAAVRADLITAIVQQFAEAGIPLAFASSAPIIGPSSTPEADS